jgi:hypothetical protein
MLKLRNFGLFSPWCPPLAEQKSNGSFFEIHVLSDLIDEVSLVRDVYPIWIIRKHYEGRRSGGRLGSVVNLDPSSSIAGRGDFSCRFLDEVIKVGG